MNKEIKSMCLELAKLALETKDVYVSLMEHCITIHHFRYKDAETIYRKIISFKYDKDVAESIREALDYIKSLEGGNIK